MIDKVLHSSKRFDWRTPREILDLVNMVDEIIFDPCASEDKAHWFAEINQTKADDSLYLNPPYHKMTFINPPYGRSLMSWVEYYGKVSGICQGILLVPARTDTAWFRDAWHYSSAYCFWRGRITFDGAPNPAPFPSVLFYKGERPYKFCHVFQPKGIVGIIKRSC